ncbi:TRAM domain-containing protein [candidate division WWE3 bacterium]|uniref:TRAM domain-containing protein n=1 Tax=candidate division WWE3 bacterium TaxID=2053526 RepID=A0A955RR40_UNCKA|nr:TRAM domain-containing protein [candidate division WWE3 bacterium]
MLDNLVKAVKGFKFPGIYLVFPGNQREAGGGSAKKKSSTNTKKDILIPMQPALVVDTSSLIDGRIADIVETGFISGTFIVPSFVVKELQQVADSKDSMKRNRGRRGLDVLNDLKKSKLTKFKIVKVRLEEDTIDEGVLALAQRLKGRVLTTDYNLNKVGKVSGVPILNVNELANMVKTILLPGEEFGLTVLKKGKEKDQGVGYLPDGTMVVVEGGSKLIGKEVGLRVERLLQTNAGRMIFAKPTD